MNGRTQQPQMIAGVRDTDAGQELLSPGVGLVRALAPAGTQLVEGSIVGELEVLGRLYQLVAPPGTSGVALPQTHRIAERPVGHGDAIATLGPITAGDPQARDAAAKAADAGKLVFRSPLSGRFYARPSPDKPDFVKVGDEITAGQTIALLEVMKTFNRLSYGGAGLPDRAKVRAILVRDEADVDSGTAILELEPV
jgi:acetyl-CoA carboxylase biotin carboxyl carrier protein